MIRTQISLEADAIELLDREAARTGASRSELIRRAVREQYGGGGAIVAELYARRKQRALDQAFGVWKNRKFQSGEEYIRALRSGDWDIIDG
ncbi:MAG TPA: CopG family transcriptional regulator [Gaiellaceae bacterium]|nr:CopG family transcriptional regulator [Gaiellaceae bacterium]